MNRSRTRCVQTPRRPSDAIDAAPVSLAAWRARHEAAVRAAATAPVRYLPAAFVEALQGSWGAPPALEPAIVRLVR